MKKKYLLWGWQLIILAAALTLPSGITSSGEYAGLEWPIDILITLIWVAFGINFWGTILKSVNAISHYTDWTVAHVHVGALGWNGFLTLYKK